MKFSRKLQLQYLIDKSSARLNKLKPHLELSDVAASLYNKVLIERAVYEKELKELNLNFFKRLLKSARTLNPSSKEYICDYFK